MVFCYRMEAGSSALTSLFPSSFSVARNESSYRRFALYCKRIYRWIYLERHLPRRVVCSPPHCPPPRVCKLSLTLLAPLVPSGLYRRWGYGMFAIILPVCTSPALYILFWADMKAQKLGVSLAENEANGELGEDLKLSICTGKLQDLSDGVTLNHHYLPTGRFDRFARLRS